ncbi:MAG: DUF1559 domain-containing protein [Phycisphaerales bacterium]|nr:DUF1559 domain-containing protein [Phycisphaerales bacterium]
MKRTARHPARAFTLIDVMVSMAVVAVLIGLLLPSLRGVTSTGKRVACSSNIRQIGLGLHMYADDWNGFVVPSRYVPGWSPKYRDSDAAEMMTLRLANDADGLWGQSWDGLGRLTAANYLDAPKIYYCPSHHGSHKFTQYADAFGLDTRVAIGNYQYRGRGPNDSRFLYDIIPSASALVSDGLQSKLDYNHQFGLNVLLADLHVVWLSDADHALYNSLPDDAEEYGAASAVNDAWSAIDNRHTTSTGNGGGGK